MLCDLDRSPDLQENPEANAEPAPARLFRRAAPRPCSPYCMEARGRSLCSAGTAFDGWPEWPACRPSPTGAREPNAGISISTSSARTPTAITPRTRSSRSRTHGTLSSPELCSMRRGVHAHETGSALARIRSSTPGTTRGSSASSPVTVPIAVYANSTAWPACPTWIWTSSRTRWTTATRTTPAPRSAVTLTGTVPRHGRRPAAALDGDAGRLRTAVRAGCRLLRSGYIHVPRDRRLTGRVRPATVHVTVLPPNRPPICAPAIGCAPRRGAAAARSSQCMQRPRRRFHLAATARRPSHGILDVACSRPSSTRRTPATWERTRSRSPWRTIAAF